MDTGRMVGSSVTIAAAHDEPGVHGVGTYAPPLGRSNIETAADRLCLHRSGRVP